MKTVRSTWGRLSTCGRLVIGLALTVDLAGGRTIVVPSAWFPRLAHGTPSERATYRLIGGGEGIHWPDLDEDISVESLLAGRRSDRKSTRLNSSHVKISYAVFCLKK